MIDHADIRTYLRFARQERLRTIHEILSDFDESFSLYSESQNDSPADIDALSNSLSSVLSATITNELCVHSHSTALLMMQYLKQHGDLKADIPRLENKGELMEMAKFERELFDNPVI
jgi:hypothetical protein